MCAIGCFFVLELPHRRQSRWRVRLVREGPWSSTCQPASMAWRSSQMFPSASWPLARLWRRWAATGGSPRHGPPRRSLWTTLWTWRKQSLSWSSLFPSRWRSYDQRARRPSKSRLHKAEEQSNITGFIYIVSWSLGGGCADQNQKSYFLVLRSRSFSVGFNSFIWIES